jgi:FdrA protein
MNIDLIRDMGLGTKDVGSCTANDLIIALDGVDESVLSDATDAVDRLLTAKSSGEAELAFRPSSLDSAVQVLPGANLVIISLPGQFAARETRRALKAGLHVMLFSDNVGVDEEIELKRLAVEKGLLMMGPDCGTAIINGMPICFANVVPRGEIGIVSASGTGLQEVSCAIAKAGAGVSQALGTGGRDLKSEAVGGAMMKLCIAALGDDPGTKTIVVISKPPLQSLADVVVDALEATGKPAVVNLVGRPAREPEGRIHFAGNLAEAASIAVKLTGRPAAKGRAADQIAFTGEEIASIAERETEKMNDRQVYLRGLFTGGTLTDEAATFLSEPLGGVYSFDAADKNYRLRDPHTSQGHTIVDLGDDVFTVGRPHPMIDPSTRNDRIDKEACDPEVAVMLLDCVLGYGSHDDPAGAMVPSIARAKEMALERGGYLSVVASVTGTEEDPQGLGSQRKKLIDAGCVVASTNYEATMLAVEIMARRVK